MPWTIEKHGEEFCVYKQDIDGNPTGEALGCHGSEGEAEDHIAGLEANVKEMVRGYVVAEFRGDFPAVETDSRVDIDALTAGDEDPFFVILPVARVGEVSANGLLYDEALVETIQEQMVGRGGLMGHIRDDERDTAFPIEDADWVGVQRENGTLWGKAYIPPGEVREYIRRLKARRGKLATSIYGPYAEREEGDGGSWRALGFELEQLDLAPADRAALNLGGRFAVTAQMTNETDDDRDESEDIQMNKEELLKELTVADLPNTLREQVIIDYEAEAENEGRIAELKGERDELLERVSELESKLDKMKRAKFEAEVDRVVSETVDWRVDGEDAEKRVKMLEDQFKNRILSEIGDEKEAERISEVAERVWESENMRLLAETVRDALSGGPAIVGGQQYFTQIEDSPEARRAARAQVGL